MIDSVARTKKLFFYSPFQIASLVKILQQFTKFGGFCLVVELNREGCAITGAILFSLGPQFFFPLLYMFKSSLNNTVYLDNMIFMNKSDSNPKQASSNSRQKELKTFEIQFHDYLHIWQQRFQTCDKLTILIFYYEVSSGFTSITQVYAKLNYISKILNKVL